MQLDDDDRRFLELLSRVIFTNPFGVEREALDAELTGLDPDAPHIVDKLTDDVSARLDALGAPGEYGSAADATLVEHALLFEGFHRFAERFDDLIAREERRAERQPIPFLPDLRELLTRRGLPASRVDRAVELFFQLRRAYYFVIQGLVGVSPCMRTLREAIWRNVFTNDAARYERHLYRRMQDFATIVLGETGAGKGAVAAAIGRSGFIPLDGDRFAESFTQTFVPLNLSELPETLLESELFGHRKGAFTGAVDDHEGVFARSRKHGAIFLDEIGELAPSAQVKLLRVLQDRTFTPLGSHQSLRFEGRVIAATHRSITELRQSGRFRHDLYYRLCSDVIEVPPLRQRLAEEPKELDALLEVILRRITGEAPKNLLGELRQAIHAGVGEGYAWPGNVRELEQAVRRVLLTGACAPDPCPPESDDPAPSRFWLDAERGEVDALQLVAGYCALLYEREGSYEAVARITGLDRRTVKKRVLTGRPLVS